MNSGELYDLFRSDVVDQAEPYLWTDDEVWRYMDAAYRMFVRLTGGIADFTTTEVTQLAVTTGVDQYALHPAVLRIMQATRLSDGIEIKVVNVTDLPRIYADVTDYGQLRTLTMKNVPGEVRWMVTGQERGKVKVLNIPQHDDTIGMVVYRLPLVNVVDDTHDLGEVADDHHLYLRMWMKALAYRKQDAETYDLKRAMANEADFRAYCAQAKAEWERYKHKTRVVQYKGAT